MRVFTENIPAGRRRQGFFEDWPGQSRSISNTCDPPFPAGFALKLELTEMANQSVTIPLDPKAARAYNAASPEERRKMQALLSLWLRELAQADSTSVQQVLDEVGEKARERGLTPEVLDSILKGA